MVVNVNVGVLGHVDSGKTHLVKALSTQLSTAALDKHPQSQQRGITLDLGFSAFRLANQEPSDADLQITLVDCPGHASLFKTILGGVAIVDCVLLVVDVRKGVQPQTLECLLVAQLAVQQRIVIALNKIDTLPLATRALAVQRAQDDLRVFLGKHFPQLSAEEIAIVPVAVAPAAEAGGEAPQPIGLELLVQAIRSRLDTPTRDTSGPFSMAIDHCFAIQGNGTILTGTVLSGSLRVGDIIELVGLGLQKPVKSIQAFKQSVDRAQQGDRVGLRVNGLDASLVERGVAVTPQSMPFVRQVVVPVYRIAFFQSVCKSSAKCHVTIGHTTAIAVVTFFTRLGSEPQAESAAASRDAFDALDLYEYVAQLDPIGATVSGDTEVDATAGSVANQRPLFALLQLDRAILCLPDAVAVCTRLDLNAKKFPCRLAFYGPIQGAVLEPSKTAGQQQMDLQTSRWQNKVLELRQLRIGRIKTRSGTVDKVTTGGQQVDVIGKDMFAKDADLSVYLGTTVMCEISKALLNIVAPFGKTGKFRLQLIDESPAGVLPSPGERFELRFLKVMALKSPAGQAPKPAAASSVVEASQKLLQDVRMLYPEAFAQPQSSDTKVFEEGVVSGAPSDASLVTELSALSVAAASESSSLEAAELVAGTIERLKGETTSDGRNPFVIVSGLFASDAEALKSVGSTVFCWVSLPGHAEQVVEQGQIEKPFGKAGKVRVVFAVNGGTLAQVGQAVYLQP